MLEMVNDFLDRYSIKTLSIARNLLVGGSKSSKMLATMVDDKQIMERLKR